MIARTIRGAWKRLRRTTPRVACLLGAATVVAAALAARIGWGPEPASAASPEATAAATAETARAPAGAPAAAEKPKMEVVAIVNGDKISRNDLAREALRHYGPETLEALLNKHLILEHCKLKNVTVTTEEVSAEIDRMSERFGLSTDNWLKMLEEERHISPVQYARDIIWPSLALRKLADARLQVTDAELQQAYETQFGPSVQVRLIAVSNLKRAEEILAVAKKNPESFGNLAKEHSEDVNSASVKGLVQPIHLHQGDPKLQVAFSMQPGQVSDIIAIENQYVILKCDGHIPGRKVPMEQVHKVLYEACRDKKLRLVANDVLQELQKECRVENVYGDAAKRQQYPGIAAIINDKKITVLELAEECIERSGKQALEGTINRRLLEQACRQRKVTVTDKEIEEEIARGAVLAGKTHPDGTPDVEAWLKTVVEKQKTSLDIYRNDVVWPTVALKKLVLGQVEVTREDLQKGYEANYGPRVRCLAIVFNQPRKAQEVWEMARNRPTVEFFGNLAEEYSIEPSSRALRGEIPPIQKHGGQALLEKEAFALAPGELSGVIQVGERYVILLCQGHTEPTGTKFEEVRDLIYEDIYDKKLRLAMAREFDALQQSAQIDNFLAGTTQSPYKGKSVDEWMSSKQGKHPPAGRQAGAMPQTLKR